MYKYMKYGMIALTVILLIGLLLTNLAACDIWSDEACTLATANDSFAGMTFATAIDVHPPLYYYLIKLCNMFLKIEPRDTGRMIILGRLASLIPICLMFVISSIIGIIKDNNVYLFCPFLLCQFNPITHFSCEIRMYTWALLFVTLTAAVALRINKDSTFLQWCMLVISSLLVCYTHYFAVFPVAILWLLLGAMNIRCAKFRRRYCLAGFSVVVGYVPWIANFVRQFSVVGKNYWISEATWTQLKDINAYLLSPWVIVRCFFYLMFFAAIWCIISLIKKQRRYAAWMIVAIFMPYLLILLALGIQEIYRPILVDRYIGLALGIVALGEALLINKLLQSKKIVMTVCSVLMVVMAIGLSFVNTYSCYRIERTYGTSWEQMIENISMADANVYLYMGKGSSLLVRPLTVMFPDAVHICENANMTEYNQYLFHTQNYEGQNLNESAIIITPSDYEMDDYNELVYLGSYYTFNVGSSSVWYYDYGNVNK